MNSTVPPSLADRLYSKRDAAKALGRSKRYVEKLLTQGELTGFTYEGVVFITRASVDARLAEIAAAIP